MNTGSLTNSQESSDDVIVHSYSNEFYILLLSAVLLCLFRTNGTRTFRCDSGFALANFCQLGSFLCLTVGHTTNGKFLYKSVEDDLLSSLQEPETS